MGATQSYLSGKEGYHILEIEPESPADLAGLESYFDFIIGVDKYDLVRKKKLLFIKERTSSLPP
jgi:hypothetical protein